MAPASAAPSTSVISGVAADKATGTRLANVDVRLFSVNGSSWSYRTVVTSSAAGEFTFEELPAGDYVLQLVDRRPSWDVSKHVTTDVPITVGSDASVRTTAFMEQGAWLWGKVTRSKKKSKASDAGIRAVRDGDTTGTVYSVRANSRGAYALGGLPIGTYTVFVEDAKFGYTAKPKRVTLRKLGQSNGVSFSMTSKASRYTGLLRAGGLSLRDPVWVTLVNRTTGQFWVTEVTGGALNLRGLSAGSYTLQVPGADRYLGETFTLPKLKIGKSVNLGALDLTAQGGQLTGTVVDAQTNAPLAGVSVTIKDKYDHPFETAQTDRYGRFDIGGSIPDEDNPVQLVIEARNSVNEVNYLPKSLRSLQVDAGHTYSLGTITLARRPAPTPTPTATASTLEQAGD